MHEIAIMPVPAGATVEQVQSALTQAEAATPVASTLGPDWATWQSGPVNGVGATSPGGSVLAQFDLAPGTYAAVCFVPDETGVFHFMHGMLQVFTVAPATSA